MRASVSSSWAEAKCGEVPEAGSEGEGEEERDGEGGARSGRSPVLRPVKRAGGDAFRLEGGEFVVAEAEELPEDVVVVLGEGGGGEANVGGGDGHAPVRALHLPDAGDGVGDGLEEAAGAEVLVGEDGGDGEDRGSGDAGGLERLRSVARAGVRGSRRRSSRRAASWLR